jgi:alpha-ketoglutarate-dependent taurine dioxygenase
VGDVVIWDNRSVSHRATAFDNVNRRRLMQRATVSNPAVLETPAYRQIETRRSV